MGVVSAIVTALIAEAAALAVTLSLEVELGFPVALVWLTAGAVLVYATTAGVLGAYDLGTFGGWALLVIDTTWSLTNTVVGTLVGFLVYLWFGSPSRVLSRKQAWVALRARGSSGFGVDVLQTVGPVNLGGSGAHEPVHLVQARLFGPTFIPLVVVSYTVTGLVQVLSIPVCLLLMATGARESWHLRPPAGSAVAGFFGWIYYATPFELWAYGTEKA